MSLFNAITTFNICICNSNFVSTWAILLLASSSFEAVVRWWDYIKFSQENKNKIYFELLLRNCIILVSSESFLWQTPEKISVVILFLVFFLVNETLILLKLFAQSVSDVRKLFPL